MIDLLVPVWLGVASVWAFLLFGFDKRLAQRRNGRRISESSLLLASALGGWPGGMLGMAIFRHKSAKPSFGLKFATAFFVWAAFVVGAQKLAGSL
ncbi:MAG: DUF1294 domain-containing protein [Opitutaceae bacterium]|nr:DUF1294 domain-containing protein [Opitutaceae bacterium]